MGQALFSIVIPTFKRQPRLRALLDSLALQTMPRDQWEVIVVDDQSGEDLRPLMDAYAGAIHVRCAASTVKGRPGARNTGARLAQGNILLFLDDDVTVNRTFLVDLARAHADQPGCLVVGKIVPGDDDRNLWTVVINRRFDLHQKHLLKNPTDLPFYCVTTGNLSIGKERFHFLGGFDEISFQTFACEDFDFGKRCHDAGITIIYNPASVACHSEGKVSVDDVFSGARSLANGMITLLNKHKDILREYDNYRTFPVALGKTHVPRQSWHTNTVKRLICSPPLLEIAARIIPMAWRTVRAPAIVHVSVKLKDLIELRYYRRAASVIWME